jgi:hypothetical protein
MPARNPENWQTRQWFGPPGFGVLRQAGIVSAQKLFLVIFGENMMTFETGTGINAYTMK